MDFCIGMLGWGVHFWPGYFDPPEKFFQLFFFPTFSILLQSQYPARPEIDSSPHPGSNTKLLSELRLVKNSLGKLMLHGILMHARSSCSLFCHRPAACCAVTKETPALPATWKVEQVRDTGTTWFIENRTPDPRSAAYS